MNNLQTIHVVCLGIVQLFFSNDRVCSQSYSKLKGARIFYLLFKPHSEEQFFFAKEGLSVTEKYARMD